MLHSASHIWGHLHTYPQELSKVTQILMCILKRVLHQKCIIAVTDFISVNLQIIFLINWLIIWSSNFSNKPKDIQFSHNMVAQSLEKQACD